MNKTIPIVRLFTRPGCTLCEPVKYIIQRSKNKFITPTTASSSSSPSSAFVYEEINIDLSAHHEWHMKYTNDIPVVHINGIEVARHRMEEKSFIQKLIEAGCKMK